MKKLLIIAAVLLLIQKWDIIAVFFNPPPDYSAEHSERVVLYATSWCGACAATRKFLSRNDIDYYEYDIEKSAEGRRQHQSLGKSGVPVLLIDGKLIYGYDPTKMSQLLGL